MSFYNWAMENSYKNDLTIDRINVNGNYEPNNCRWITNQEQQNNRTDNVFYTYNGETLTRTQWAKKLNCTSNVIRYKMDKIKDFSKVYKQIAKERGK